jgi:hypothetical protein
MTTIKVTSGDMGSESMSVRCDLSQASAAVEVNYGTGDGWESTQYQCADCRHTVDGLKKIAKVIAAQAVEMPESQFTADFAEVE